MDGGGHVRDVASRCSPHLVTPLWYVEIERFRPSFLLFGRFFFLASVFKFYVWILIWLGNCYEKAAGYLLTVSNVLGFL